MYHIWTVDQGQKDHLATEGQHALFPVFRFAFALLIYPILRCDFGSKLLPVQEEQPYIRLDALAELLLKEIYFACMPQTLDRLGAPA